MRVPVDWLLIAIAIAIVGVIVLALLSDVTNGFHHAANSVATVVATRAMPARWALVLGVAEPVGIVPQIEGQGTLR